VSFIIINRKSEVIVLETGKSITQVLTCNEGLVAASSHGGREEREREGKRKRERERDMILCDNGINRINNSMALMI
jgi:hypothetical protein